MARKLRIAASVFFAVVAVLLCVLWVRSYRVCDVVFHTSTKHVVTTFGSNSGAIYMIRAPLPALPQVPGLPARTIHTGWKLGGDESTKVKSFFEWKLNANDVFIRLPTAVLVLVAIVGACAAWWREISVRFSLRTLLIATTLVAVVLGLGVLAAR